MLEVERARNLLTVVSQYILVVVRPPRLTCNGARANATRCVSAPVRALRSCEDRPLRVLGPIAVLCEMRLFC